MQDHGTKSGPERLVLVQGIKKQISELEQEIERLRRQRDEVAAVQEALEHIEAVLLRMSMLAREAASLEDRRPGLAEEFEGCKRTILELSELAEPYLFNPERVVAVRLPDCRAEHAAKLPEDRREWPNGALYDIMKT